MRKHERFATSLIRKRSQVQVLVPPPSSEPFSPRSTRFPARVGRASDLTATSGTWPSTSAIWPAVPSRSGAKLRRGMTTVTCARQFCPMADQVGGTLGQAPAGTIHELQRHASIWRPGSTKPVRLLAIDDGMHSTQHRGAQALRIPPVHLPSGEWIGGSQSNGGAGRRPGRATRDGGARLVTVTPVPLPHDEQDRHGWPHGKSRYRSSRAGDVVRSASPAPSESAPLGSQEARCTRPYPISPRLLRTPFT